MDVSELMQVMQKENGGKPIGTLYEWNTLWDQYIAEKSGEYMGMCVNEAIPHMISAANYQKRKDCYSCEEMGVHIHVGDIAYIDFGEAYRGEIGFQHFALILKLYHNKAFVVPMSGNYRAYLQAFGKDNPTGKKHLMRFGKLPGMNKESVLFINDAKWINTARVIDIKAHIEKSGELFQEVKCRVMNCLW